MNGDTKLILSLINRISLKLPCHSGKKLEILESDPLILQIVNSIIDLSRFKLSTIANNLTQLLETISKSTTMVLEDFVPFEVLQSQLFILKILSACMTNHWKWYRGTQRELEATKSSKSLKNTDPSSSSSSSPPVSSVADDTSSITTLVNQPNQPKQQFKLPRSWDDPPPLEDSLAKYILSVLSRFLHQMASQEDNITGTTPNGTPTGPSSSTSNSPTAPQGSSATFDIISDIYKNAGRVIFYISASNWAVVFSRIKNRIGYLTSTNDEWPETSELKLLECSDLNQERLTAVLKELRGSFLHLKRSAQTMMANVLRKAIWNWIEVFPAEFVTLYQNQKRFEGGAEILFDYCNNLADNNTKKRPVFWPLQTMLLILCPDILYEASMSDRTSSMSKKVAFLDSLKQALRKPRLADVAAVCYVDICKASTYVSRSDNVALRHIVPDIENDLKAKLFDPSRPFMNESQIDQKLMTDCLTALFRLNQDTLGSLIPICLGENAPNAFKLVLVKSCYAIASEENRFPWNPSLSSVYSVLAVPLRQLFQQNINFRDKSNDPKKKKYKADELNEKIEIVLNIIKLYKSDPLLALAYCDPDQYPEEIRHVIYGIALCVNDNNNAIRTTAAETLLALHNLEYIEQWGSEDKKMSSFWSISSQVMLAIARQILEYKEREESTKYLLELLLQLFIRRNQFLKVHKEESTVGINAPERLGCNVVLEIALLVLLCSSDQDICSMSLNCFGHLCQEAQLTAELVHDEMDVQAAPPNELPIVENMDIYLELSSGPYIIPGRIAQQKRIRKLLRLMKVATPGNLAAWEEAYKRWKNLTGIIARPTDEPQIESSTRIRGLPWSSNPGRVGNNLVIVPEAQNTEWLYYTGFLSSLGGVCVNEKQMNTLVNGRTNDSSINEHSDRRINIPQGSNYHLMVEKFVQEMVDLLVCDSAYVRESVRETLGAELNTRLYVILFKHLESIVSRFFDQDGEANPTDRYTLFVEQAISVLKLILERIQDASENLYTVDLGGLVLSFARYLNRLGSGQITLRIKKRMCQLAEILMLKKDYVTLRQEIKLRNRLLEIFIEWTSDFTMKTDGQGGSETSSNKSEKLHRDLDQTCLKTIVFLLHQLPLQPPDAVHESDLSGVKSRLFYKYFSFFIKLLNRCRILEAIDSGTHSAKNNQDLQMLLSKSKEYVKDLGPLKDYTILALSNLLSANVDSGLKYSLSMGYHEDTKTRTAFMQVLTNILNQGTEFEGLAENAMKDRYEKLVELITESDLNITLSLCEVCPVSDIDEVSKTLLAVFESRNKTMPLLKAIIEKEVINTEYESDLFRRNCMATRMLAAFAKAHGAEYLRETLQPLLNDLLSKPSDFSCELNPNNLSPGEESRNLQNLKATAQAFLDGICASGPNMPRAFREVCHYIGNSVEEKYKRAKCVTVGAFVFLRFFNPAIVSPDTENLCKHIENQKIRRALLLITKVIQNLANNVLFGAKEPYMIVLNDFLNDNIVKVTTFLEEISKLPYIPQFADIPTGDNTNVRRLEDSERKALHRHLVENQEKMAKDLQTRRVKSINPAAPANSMLDQAQANKKAWDSISKLLAQLGPPAASQKKEFPNINNNHLETNNQLFKEFMIRNKIRNVESIVSKGVFYDGGFSKERRRVFYLILRRLDAEATDMELLMYHVLNTIEPFMGQPYELLVDVTMFGAANEIQLQWAQQFMHILPFDAIENLSALYFYNTNTAFKKFSKKLSRLLSSKIIRKTIFLCNLNELHDYISPAEVRLPKSTTQLDTDPNVIYTPVTRISHYRMQVPVIMKISHETIQILTTRKQDLFNGLNCQLNDVYHISEIEDIAPSSHKNDDNEFIIKQDRGRPSLTLTSTKRDSIMQAIRASKARYQIAKPTNITERVIRPSDVPGTLLNMALLNIGSDDPNLRLAAYNLLVALSLIFNFDVGGQLLGAKGLCIPANNTSFVVGLSERLASLVPQLTPDFLCEFFVGFDKSSTPLKHLCLQYMAPWLNNLAQFTRSGADSQQNINKTREIIKNLIELTTKENEMYTAVQSKIWSTLGKVDEITNIIIDEFVQYAVEHGISSPQSEIVANTIVTLSSVNIRGKIIAKLRKVITRTSLKATRTLTDNPAWPEIAVLIRFNLMLSFNNRNVQLYLPELFYVISILVATGPPLIRASIHGLIVNLVQSLCTSMPLNEINVKRLTLLLTELSEPNFRYFFGLNNVPGNAFVISSESTHDLPDTMPLASLEKIVQALLEVMVCGAGSVDMSNTWRARWMGLVASTAFQHNPAVQPRAFVTLGCLAREEVDDDLLYQILVALRGALSMFTENDCSLIISIVMCLTNIVENLPADCRYLQSLFWLAMALVQISHIPVFPSAINLLNVVLKALDVNGFFANEDIATVLLKARIPLESIAIDMDREAGINYEHFSFAVSATLLKGLKNPVTKTGTKDVLNAFLDIASKGVVGDHPHRSIDASMLGYLAALLPVSAKNADMKELLWVCGIVDSEVDNSELGTTYYKIFEKLDIPDNQTALLLISLMVAMLQTAEHEPERLFLYGFLAEAALALPEVFTLVYDFLLPKMTQIINNSETIPILDSVQSILFTVVSSEARFSSNNRSTSRSNQMPSYLEEIGFTNLMDCGSFQTVTKEKMKTNAMLASELVNKIISG